MEVFSYLHYTSPYLRLVADANGVSLCIPFRCSVNVTRWLAFYKKTMCTSFLQDHTAKCHKAVVLSIVDLIENSTLGLALKGSVVCEKLIDTPHRRWKDNDRVCRRQYNVNFYPSIFSWLWTFAFVYRNLNISVFCNGESVRGFQLSSWLSNNQSHTKLSSDSHCSCRNKYT